MASAAASFTALAASHRSLDRIQLLPAADGPPSPRLCVRHHDDETLRVPFNRSRVLGHLFVGGGAVLLFCAFAAGMCIFAWGAWETMNGIASRSWPTVEGRIASVSVTEDLNSEYSSSPVWKVRFVYGYDVGGRHFRGERQSYDGGSKAGYDGDYNGSRGFLETHQEGEEILVRYNPRHPENSVLVPGLHGSSLFMMCAGVFMLCVVGFMVVGILGGLR